MKKCPPPIITIPSIKRILGRFISAGKNKESIGRAAPVLNISVCMEMIGPFLVGPKAFSPLPSREFLERIELPVDGML